MPREFGRHERIGEVIRRIAAPIFDALARDRALGLVTITDVETAGDLSLAKIFVSVLNPSNEGTLPLLREALPQIRSAVARSLRIKKIPQLALELDESVANGARIAALLAGKAHT